jgi:hypothetical protein
LFPRRPQQRDRVAGALMPVTGPQSGSNRLAMKAADASALA